MSAIIDDVVVREKHKQRMENINFDPIRDKNFLKRSNKRLLSGPVYLNRLTC